MTRTTVGTYAVLFVLFLAVQQCSPLLPGPAPPISAAQRTEATDLAAAVSALELVKKLEDGWSSKEVNVDEQLRQPEELSRKLLRDYRDRHSKIAEAGPPESLLRRGDLRERAARLSDDLRQESHEAQAIKDSLPLQQVWRWRGPIARIVLILMGLALAVVFQRRLRTVCMALRKAETDVLSAETAAESADTAAESADTAAESADTAAKSAMAAAQRTETAVESADTAAESADTAAKSAMAAAQRAETAAESAMAAAESAMAAAKSARTAAWQAIDMPWGFWPASDTDEDKLRAAAARASEVSEGAEEARKRAGKARERAGEARERAGHARLEAWVREEPRPAEEQEGPSPEEDRTRSVEERLATVSRAHQAAELSQTPFDPWAFLREKGIKWEDFDPNRQARGRVQEQPVGASPVRSRLRGFHFTTIVVSAVLLAVAGYAVLIDCFELQRFLKDLPGWQERFDDLRELDSQVVKTSGDLESVVAAAGLHSLEDPLEGSGRTSLQAQIRLLDELRASVADLGTLYPCDVAHDGHVDVLAGRLVFALTVAVLDPGAARGPPKVRGPPRVSDLASRGAIARDCILTEWAEEAPALSAVSVLTPKLIGSAQPVEAVQRMIQGGHLDRQSAAALTQRLLQGREALAFALAASTPSPEVRCAATALVSKVLAKASERLPFGPQAAGAGWEGIFDLATSQVADVGVENAATQFSKDILARQSTAPSLPSLPGVVDASAALWKSATGGLPSELSVLNNTYDDAFPPTRQPGTSFDHARSPTQLRAAASCGGFVTGALPSETLPLDQLVWKVEGARVTLSVREEGKATLVQLLEADQDVVLSGLRFAADERRVVVTMQPCGDGRLWRVLHHPAISDTKLGEECRKVDTWTDTASLEDLNLLVIRCKRSLAVSTFHRLYTETAKRLQQWSKLNNVQAHDVVRFARQVCDAKDCNKVLMRSPDSAEVLGRYLMLADCYYDRRLASVLRAILQPRHSLIHLDRNRWDSGPPSVPPSMEILALVEEQSWSLASLDDLRDGEHGRSPLHFGLRACFTEESPTGWPKDVWRLSSAAENDPQSFSTRLNRKVHESHKDEPTMERVSDFVRVARLARVAFEGRLGARFPLWKLVELHRELTLKLQPRAFEFSEPYTWTKSPSVDDRRNVQILQEARDKLKKQRRGD